MYNSASGHSKRQIVESKSFQMVQWSRIPAPVKVLHLSQWNGAAGFDDEDGSVAVAALEAALASKRKVVDQRYAPAPIGASIAIRNAREAEEIEVELLLDDSELDLEAAEIAFRDLDVDDVDFAAA